MASHKVVALVFFMFSLLLLEIHGHPNYGDALAKSILFFQGQRSGRLPSDQKISWRSVSGLSDGSAANVKNIVLTVVGCCVFFSFFSSHTYVL